MDYLLPTFHKSSRKPLKNGCRTLPSADLARYPISAESDGSTPDATVRDLFRIRLSLADQRLQSCLHLPGGRRVKTVVDFAGIDQVLAPAPADVAEDGGGFVCLSPGPSLEKDRRQVEETGQVGCDRLLR